MCCGSQIYARPIVHELVSMLRFGKTKVSLKPLRLYKNGVPTTVSFKRICPKDER